MFEFIKQLFKKEEKVETVTPVVVHAEVGETIVIKEVALAEIEGKPAKAKGVKPAKAKPVVDNVVPLVQPVAEKAVKPKKPAKPKKVKVEVKEDVKLTVVTSPKPKGRPKKTPTE
jgi:hypothetical protein